MSVSALAAVAARGSWSSGARGEGGGAAGFAVEATVGLVEKHSSLYVRWKEHPDKCMDVWGNHAGAQVQMWSCNDFHGAAVEKESDFKWILPPLGEPGPIVWAGNTSFCLNAPEGNQIQIWYCNTAPVQHTRWKITADGRIHLAYLFGKCLDIPNGEKALVDGVKLQLWDCMEGGGNEKEGNVLFDVYAQSCEWSEWSEWSACSVTCGGGERYQARRVQKQAINGGRPCTGPVTRSSPCADEQCTTSGTTTTITTTITTNGAAAPDEETAWVMVGKGECDKQGWKWEPLNMDGQERTEEDEKLACQVRCAVVPFCAHFSYWDSDGGCHLQDAAAKTTMDLSVASGPPVCE